MFLNFFEFLLVFEIFFFWTFLSFFFELFFALFWFFFELFLKPFLELFCELYEWCHSVCIFRLFNIFAFRFHSDELSQNFRNEWRYFGVELSKMWKSSVCQKGVSPVPFSTVVNNSPKTISNKHVKWKLDEMFKKDSSFGPVNISISKSTKWEK